MRCRNYLTLLLPVLLLCATTSQATVRSDPVRVRMLDAPRAAEAGQPYTGTLRVEIGKAGELGAVRLHGEGWQVELATLPAGARTPGEVFDLPFAATPVDPTVPLEFEMTFDGKPWSRTVDLSPAAFERARVGVAKAEFNPKGEYPEWVDREPSIRMQLPGSGRVDDFLAEAIPTGDVSVTAPFATTTLTVVGQAGYTHLETGEFVGAQNASIAVWSTNGGWIPVFQALGTTDAYGDFRLTFEWPESGVGTRLWVQFSAVNSDARLEHTDIWEDTWSWQGPIAVDVGPGTYNFGRLAPRKESHQGAIHIANTIARGNQVYMNYGYNLSRVDVQWAEGGEGSFYKRAWNELHITRSDSFNESVILHEFSHYWMDIFAAQPTIDYCNDMCDDEIDWWFDDCGHCLWCEEDQAIAWNEGLPDFLSQIMTDHIKANYSVPGNVNAYNFQSIRPDSRCEGLQTALRTEGYFAAALYDLHDSSDSGEDDQAYPGWSDRLGGYLGAILQVASNPIPGHPFGWMPTTPGVFLDTFHEQYPAISEDLWETLMNNGCVEDDIAPALPTGMAALDHVVGTPSPDNTITITWDAPVDDYSGVGGYSYLFNYGSMGIAVAAKNLGPSRSVSSPPLAEGDWYFSLRVLDRAGNWTIAQANLGPFTIRAAEPADMTHEQPSGWQYPLVPRNDGTSSVTSATVSSYLQGDSDETWWNVAGRNIGEALMPVQPEVGLLLDGVQITAASFTRLGGGNWSYRANLGPVAIPAGRHTLDMFLDSGEDAAESNENNNHWARQWVWLPPSMTAGVKLTRPAPPERNGGFEHIHSGSIGYYNCDGFKTQASVAVQAVWMFGEGTQTDYDLRLYDAVTNPDTGFQVSQELSSRNYGRLDAILIHGINDGLAVHNVSVQNFSSSDRDYHIGKLEGTFMSPPESADMTLTTNRMMYLRTINIPSGTSGDISLILRTQTGSQTLSLAYFPHDFVTAGLAGAAQTVTARNGETAQIDVTVPGGQFAAVAVYRDPDGGTGPVSFTLDCLVTPPDLVAVTPTDWHGNIVPQPNASILYPFDAVPAPPTLTGFTGSTYLYMSEENRSIVDSPGHNYEIRLDGALLSWFSRPALTAGQLRKFKGASPYTIPGGRHTLGISLDAAGAVGESSETNNAYGEQWMWTGPTLELDAPRTYPAPALRTAGFEDITTGLIYYNSLGLHSPVFSTEQGAWAGVYLAAESSVDVDLRLHEPFTDMSNGLTNVVESSTWVGSECDFVIANFQQRPHQAFDIGVVNVVGAGDVVVAAVGTTPGALVAGENGPFALGSGLGLRLHEAVLDAGTYRFDLRPLSGEPGNLGFSLYGPLADFYAKDGALPDAMAWQAAPGQIETFVVNVPQAGTYCLAVWMVGNDDLRSSLEYALVIDNVSGVEDEMPVPRRTRLVAAAPNPFNPMTTIHYELAVRGVAVLEIYNTRGVRVRELVRADLSAGRHRTVWDGRNTAGEGVASGVYYVRLRGGDATSLIKVTLLK